MIKNAYDFKNFQKSIVHDKQFRHDILLIRSIKK